MGWESPQDAPGPDLVLVDTSVWIDFLNGGRSRESERLSELIAQEGDLATCGWIRQEVLQGVRDDLSHRRIARLFDQTTYLNLEEPAMFDDAAALYRTLRKKGKTIRSPADCLIATIAMRHQCLLLHRDRDFNTIASASSLKLYV